LIYIEVFLGVYYLISLIYLGKRELFCSVVTLSIVIRIVTIVFDMKAIAERISEMMRGK